MTAIITLCGSNIMCHKLSKLCHLKDKRVTLLTVLTEVYVWKEKRKGKKGDEGIKEMHYFLFNLTNLLH
jgi:predicted metal-binding transcription factor (methanogenesis marker protein 9)